jgi:zinc transport system substrate-binding protein
MINKLFTILTLILINHSATAKPKIVASITPIASIVAMLVQDQVELQTITTTKGCPHHYNLKPSDLKTIEDANLVIYVSDEFDGFTAKLMKSHNTNVIKISDMKSIRIIDNNWHFWLDLNNVQNLLAELSFILIKQFPEMKSTIYSNLDKSKKQIENLKDLKNLKLSNLQKVILLNDSLEYFFSFQENKIRLYQSHNSPRYIATLEKILSTSTKNCLVLSSDQQDKVYKKFNTTTIELDSENWTINGKIETLFYNHYIEMIDEVAKCSL